MTTNTLDEQRYESVRVLDDIVIYDRKNHTAWIQMQENHVVEVGPHEQQS